MSKLCRIGYAFDSVGVLRSEFKLYSLITAPKIAKVVTYVASWLYCF